MKTPPFPARPPAASLRHGTEGLRPRKSPKAPAEVDVPVHPGVRDLELAVDLEAKMDVVGVVGELLRVEPALAVDVLQMDVEGAGVLLEREEVAAEGADFVLEDEDEDPDFEDEGQVRVDFAFELLKE